MLNGSEWLAWKAYPIAADGESNGGKELATEDGAGAPMEVEGPDTPDRMDITDCMDITDLDCSDRKVYVAIQVTRRKAFNRIIPIVHRRHDVHVTVVYGDGNCALRGVVGAINDCDDNVHGVFTKASELRAAVCKSMLQVPSFHLETWDARTPMLSDTDDDMAALLKMGYTKCRAEAALHRHPHSNVDAMNYLCSIEDVADDNIPDFRMELGCQHKSLTDYVSSLSMSGAYFGTNTLEMAHVALCTERAIAIYIDNGDDTYKLHALWHPEYDHNQRSVTVISLLYCHDPPHPPHFNWMRTPQIVYDLSDEYDSVQDAESPDSTTRSMTEKEEDIMNRSRASREKTGASDFLIPKSASPLRQEVRCEMPPSILMQRYLQGEK